MVIFYEPRDKMEYDIVLNKTEVTPVELVSYVPKLTEVRIDSFTRHNSPIGVSGGYGTLPDGLKCHTRYK